MMYQYQSLENHTYVNENTFEYGGQTYNINAVVKFKPTVKHGQKVTPVMVQLVKHNIMDDWYHTWVYDMWYKTGVVTRFSTHSPPDDVIESVVLDGKERFDDTLSDTYTEEQYASIKGTLVKGTLIYIAVMLFCAILRDCWTGWIAGTCYFVWWYKSKKQSLNHYKNGFDYNKMIKKLNS